MLSTCNTVGPVPDGTRLEKIKQSPNYRGDQFVNRIPVVDPPLFKTLVEWFKGGEQTTPNEPVSILKRTTEDFSEFPASGLRITWMGHSTTLVEIDGYRLLLDPVWSSKVPPYPLVGVKRFSELPLALEELPPIDGVLVSHDHFDHLDRATIEKLAGKVPRFIVPLGVGARLEKWGVSEDQIVEMDWWQQTRLGDLTITATPARHFSGRSAIMSDRNKTLWSGFAIRSSDHNVYYSGDTGMFDGFTDIGEKLGPFDVSLIEVGAYNQLWADVHLGPEQALQAFQQVRGGLFMPVHWSTFDLAMHSWTEPVERVMAAAELRGIPLAIPKPGESIEPSSPPEVAKWWPDGPWKTVEQQPVISSGLKAQASNGVTQPEQIVAGNLPHKTITHN